MATPWKNCPDASSVSDCWCGGGVAGFRKHTNRVNKTEPCPESRLANTLYQREWRERNPKKIKEYRTRVPGWRVGADVDLSDDAL